MAAVRSMLYLMNSVRGEGMSDIGGFGVSVPSAPARRPGLAEILPRARIQRRGRENDPMALQERRGTRSRTKWFTTAFWILTAVFVYRLIGIPFWWEWLTFIIGGVSLTYAWWRRRRRGRYAILSGVTCALVAGVTLSLGGATALAAVSVPVDSVGPRKIECGSVVNPVPGSELTVTTGGPGYPTVQPSPIPQSELERVCSDRLGYRAGDAAGLALLALLLGVRATGHFIPRRDCADG